MAKQAYLFVHFKEKRTPDGEQVYFSVSRDGFHWETVNGGNPVLWSYLGEKGVRDHTIIRTKDNHFVIMATDLSLAYEMKNTYHNSWPEISAHGSTKLMMWESEDLIHWSPQREVTFDNGQFGCVWAPDIIFDRKNQDYVVHWSSSKSEDDYRTKAIYYSRTKDFQTFSKPELLYEQENPAGKVIDSAMYEEDGRYYLFIKSEVNPKKIVLMTSDAVTGPFTKVDTFDESMRELEESRYEAPTAVKLEDGRWCLFLDYYGCSEEQQGYVPFVSESLASGKFVRSDSQFTFPYGFKHGTILTITEDEYQRLKAYQKQPWEV